MKILIIEDDKDIAELVDYNLCQAGFVCECMTNGASGLSKAKKNLPDLIVLDLMLPQMNGLEVCKTLKGDAATKNIPIVMLTAKGEEIDKVVGFELGADDYITKPFSPRELVLRVKAILRRGQDSSQALQKEPFTFGILHVDPVKFFVRAGHEEVRLTAIEFKLLQYLISTQGRVASRDQLLDQVWGYEAALTTRTVDTHIKRLREKLGEAGSYIETLRGIGYRFKESP